MDRAGVSQTKWTTLVCTVALGLAAAGVLQRLKAATHWLGHDVLQQFGSVPTNMGSQRYV